MPYVWIPPSIPRAVAWLTLSSPPPAVAPCGSGVLCWQRPWGCGRKRRAVVLLSDDLPECFPSRLPHRCSPGLGG